jgi:hypothetical protein
MSPVDSRRKTLVPVSVTIVLKEAISPTAPTHHQTTSLSINLTLGLPTHPTDRSVKRISYLRVAKGETSVPSFLQSFQSCERRDSHPIVSLTISTVFFSGTAVLLFFCPKRTVFLTKRVENLVKRIASCLANATSLLTASDPFGPR